MLENSYIVRIYRRKLETGLMDTNEMHTVKITGKINNVNNDRWQTFHNKDELWKLIAEQVIAEEA